MVCLRNSPKTPEELYEFFKDIARPPVKSHVIYIGSQFAVREDWVMFANLDRYNRYGLWFHYKESDPPRWNAIYEKYKTKE
jgi:hypothetical protein